MWNAIKYGSSGTPTRAALGGDEAEVRLEVTNSGPGIDRSALCQLFDPLKRAAEEGCGHDGRGLGLGLFIVREIVEAHGGDIEVRCSSGETTFAVRLPRHGKQR